MNRSISTIFAEVTMTHYGLQKNLSDGTVMADAKAVYVGSRGNWKFSWKHVTEVTFGENRSLIIKTMNEQTFECLDADPSTRRSFFEFMEKQWSKRQAKLHHEKPATSTRRPTKARRTYGRSGTRPSAKMTPVAYFSSDDEQETLKESCSEPEQDLSPAHEEVDDASMHDEEDVVKEGPPEKGTRSKRNLLKKAHTAHEDESDDDVFDDSAVATTPAAQRIVSPANDTPTKESGTPSKPPAKGNSTITSFFGTKTAAVKPITISQRATTPTKTRPTLPLSLTPTRRPLKRDTEWLTSTWSTPRTKQARSRFFYDDVSDVDSVSATPPPKNMGSGLSFTLERDSIESSPPTRKRFFVKRPHILRDFRPQATQLHPSPKRSLADDALGLSSRSPTTPVVNPYRAKPREDVAARCPFPGLKNLGNTCYLNSSLQLLYSVPTFVASLEEKGGDLSNTIFNLWKDLKDTSSLRARNPTCVKKAMDAVTTKFVGYEQRDAHEFLSDLVDLVHDELQEEQNATGDTSTLSTDEFFRMNVQVCLTCDSCGYARNKEEMYRHLSLAIADHVPQADGTPTPWSIQRALERFFEPEKRELKCEKCHQGVSATQKLRILSCPKALVLHLKRFAIVEKLRMQAPILEEKQGDATETVEGPKHSTAVEVTFRKNKAPVAVDAQLSLRPYSAAGEEEKENLREETYDLKSVVCHIGSTANSGHYTADAIRSSESKMSETWVSFDDGMTSLTSTEQVLNDEKNQRTAYILLYTLG